jgi:nucleotide-binding universal stress UspA family protein
MTELGTTIARSTPRFPNVIDLRDILCPTDFSESSRVALSRATELAPLFGAAMRVLHVLSDEPSHIARVHEPSPEGRPGRPLEVRKRAEAELRRFVGSVEHAGVTVEAQVRLGDPLTTILEASVEPRTDLLIMGTHERSGGADRALGSVAEKVIRRVHCPILTVGPDATPPPSRHVLCPTDFSASSKQALEWARVVAARTGASLEVLHVVERLEERRGRSSGEARGTRQGAEEALDVLLSGWSREADTPSDVTSTVVQGSAHGEIVSVAREHAVDLIVMGAHGHGFIDRMLFGSTAHRVVREAPCPVLSVRPPAGSA